MHLHEHIRAWINGEQMFCFSFHQKSKLAPHWSELLNVISSKPTWAPWLVSVLELWRRHFALDQSGANFDFWWNEEQKICLSLIHSLIITCCFSTLHIFIYLYTVYTETHQVIIASDIPLREAPCYSITCYFMLKTHVQWSVCAFCSFIFNFQ